MSLPRPAQCHRSSYAVSAGGAQRQSAVFDAERHGLRVRALLGGEGRHVVRVLGHVGLVADLITVHRVATRVGDEMQISE